MTTPATATAPTGRRWLLLGLALTVLGVVAYAGQIALHRLTAPWYVPIVATMGVVLVAASLWQKLTVWRGLGLIVVVLVAGAAWAFMFMTRLPAYTGPVAVGRPFPAFTTVRADGTPFTDRDLVGDRDTVLVFFRGRW
jgi:hypothetical protein